MTKKIEKKTEKPSGNGKKPEQDLEKTVPAPEPVVISQVNKPPSPQYEEIDDSAKNAPGRGFLFNVKDENIDECSDLSEREIFTFSIAEVQDAVLDLNRTESIVSILMRSIKRKKISLNRNGRTEFVTSVQLAAEEKADKSGDLFAKGI